MASMATSIYKYCPRCGHKLSWRREYKHVGHEPKRPVCPNCGFVYYEMSAPTASALIINAKKQVLLAKRAWPPAKGSWDILGGFLEAGEHPAVGVKREIREEIGVSIKLQKLLGIWMGSYYHNKHWRRTLNFYYLATITRGAPKPTDDVAAVRWFPLNRLPKPIAFSGNRAALQALGKILKKN